eukprot:XP_003729304.1 PREDICTED: metalloproteinase inhibitor 2 [Strongylocentrotus purpuratus]
MYGLAIFLIALMIGGSQACSCLNEPPADRYCKADYVIMAKVLKEDRPPQAEGNRFILNSFSTRVTYTLNIRKSTHIYRNKDGRVVQGVNNATTHSSTAACGVPLEEEGYYMLAGNYRFENDEFDSLNLVSCGSIVIKLPPRNKDTRKVIYDIWNKVYDCSSTRPVPLPVPVA